MATTYWRDLVVFRSELPDKLLFSFRNHKSQWYYIKHKINNTLCETAYLSSSLKCRLFGHKAGSYSLHVTISPDSDTMDSLTHLRKSIIKSVWDSRCAVTSACSIDELSESLVYECKNMVDGTMILYVNIPAEGVRFLGDAVDLSKPESDPQRYVSIPMSDLMGKEFYGIPTIKISHLYKSNNQYGAAPIKIKLYLLSVKNVSLEIADDGMPVF